MARDRYARLRRIEQLDPEADAWEIAQLFAADFQTCFLPMILQGFLFTFAAPRMSRILASTEQSEHHIAKRAVDTAILTAEVMEHGLGPGRGREAARRVNEMHRRYDIHPEDFLAVGVDSALGQIALAEAFGWRPVTDKEREAVRAHFAQITRVYGGPKDFPATWDALQPFHDRYVATQFAFEPQNQRMAEASIAWYAGKGGWLFSGLARRFLLGLVDARVLAHVGVPEPSALQRRISWRVMRWLGRLDPLPDGESRLLKALTDAQYPGGFTFDMLGTQAPEAPKGCPMHGAQAP
ncbi:MAG: DUF2236 domain-containing protein [Alphaproteobacteria bacterium]|nr:DUF2236 domain-containing protein [Alphaproteobacteria bacterium]